MTKRLHDMDLLMIKTGDDKILGFALLIIVFAIIMTLM